MRKLALSLLLAGFAWHGASQLAAATAPLVAGLNAAPPTGLVVIVGSKGLPEVAARDLEGRVVLLVTSDTSVEPLRREVVRRGMHGQVTVASPLDGKLPLVDLLADVLVVEDAKGLAEPELQRVVRPGGKILRARGTDWAATELPAKPGLDSWSHYNYDPTGSNHSKDTVVGPGRGVQWITGPHSSFINWYISGTFAFGMTNESPDGIGKKHVFMVNAFNGAPIWERRDIGMDSRYAVVLHKDRVFIYPNHACAWGGTPPQPHMLVLDIKTGRTIQELTEGVTFRQQKYFDATFADPAERKKAQQDECASSRDFMALVDNETLVQTAGAQAAGLDANTGKRLWKIEAAEAGWHFMWPISDGSSAYLLEGPPTRGFFYTHWPLVVVKQVRAIDLRTGEQRWLRKWDESQGDFGAINFTTASGKLILNGRTPATSAKTLGANLQQALAVVDAKTGEVTYRKSGPGGVFTRFGGHSGARIIPSGDRLWNTTLGEVLGAVSIDQPDKVLFAGFDYQRPVGCTSFRATPNWLIGNLTAYPKDATDRKARLYHSNAARNGCDVGSIPANGLLYLTPNHCFCAPYLPENVVFHSRPFQGIAKIERTVAGNAKPSNAFPTQGWTAMLRDHARTAWADDTLPATLKSLWTIDDGAAPTHESLNKAWNSNWYAQGPVTGVSAVKGLAVFAVSQRQEVVAVDPATGKERWRTGVNGRIACAPVIHAGMALVGTASGYVHALSLDTGEPVWRFFAAPQPNQILVDGMLESVWPVIGGVVVDKNRCYVFAGRHSDADGGLFWWTLDVMTGQIRASGRLGADELIEETNIYQSRRKDNLIAANNLPIFAGGTIQLPGVLLKVEGDQLMRSSIPARGLGEWGKWEANHAFGHIVSGNQGLLFRENVDGYKKPQYGGTSGNHFAVKGDDFIVVGASHPAHRGGAAGDDVARMKRTTWDQSDGKLRGSTLTWGKMGGNAKARVEAMIATANAVIIAKGTQLTIHDAETGAERQKIVLPGRVVVGGLSANDGRLFVALTNGKVMAFGASQ